MSEEVKYCKRGHPRTPENVDKYLACILCKKERRKLYYLANKEKINRNSREYARKHPEKIREYRNKWAKNNRDKINAAERKRNKENPLRCKLKHQSRVEYEKEYYKKRVKNLEKSYVAYLLGISSVGAPVELIELKRLQLQLKREVKNANIH